MPLAAPSPSAESAARRTLAIWLAGMLVVYVIADLALLRFGGQSLPSDGILLLILLSASMMAGEAYARSSQDVPPGPRLWRMAATFAFFHCGLCLIFVAILSALGVPMLAAQAVLAMGSASPGLLAGFTMGYLVVWTIVARIGLGIGLSAARKRRALEATRAASPTKTPPA